MTSSPSKGISRLSWNLRMESTSPINPNKQKPGRYDSGDDGFLVTAGIYSVEVVLVKNGVSEIVVVKTNFNVKGLNNQSTAKPNNVELMVFRKEVAELNRSISGSSRLMNENLDKLSLMKLAITNYPNTDIKLLEEVRAMELVFDECEMLIYGDGLKASKEFETPPSFNNRLSNVEYQLYESTTGVTTSQKLNVQISREEYQVFRTKLDALIIQVKALETKLSAKSIPYIKGKDEKWKMD